jgi:uncharacterized protein
VYNLLDNEMFLAFNSRPERLREEAGAGSGLVVIDEIQRVPQLLNEVHLLIEEKGRRFLLTGSSARKLRSRSVNLLGGRARVMHLNPFVTKELGDDFTLERALNHGMLPPVYFSDDPGADLRSYVGTYLKTEVAAEALTRDIPAFSRFLGVAALCNARIVNFTNVANDAQVKRTTVYEYFEILKDTLLLRELTAFRKGQKRKPVSSSKYYFFDAGVARQLQGRVAVTPGTPEYGEAFETFIMNEAFAFSDYVRPTAMNFWRTSTNLEADLLLNEEIAIEIKAKPVIGPEDLKGLKAIAEEARFKKLLCVCLEKRPRKTGDIEILPYQEFLGMLWAGQLV